MQTSFQFPMVEGRPRVNADGKNHFSSDSALDSVAYDLVKTSWSSEFEAEAEGQTNHNASSQALWLV